MFNKAVFKVGLLINDFEYRLFETLTRKNAEMSRLSQFRHYFENTLIIAIINKYFFIKWFVQLNTAVLLLDLSNILIIIFHNYFIGIPERNLNVLVTLDIGILIEILELEFCFSIRWTTQHSVPNRSIFCHFVAFES